MHDRKRKIQLYCAKLLILMSFGLFTYGFILDLKGSHKIVDVVSDYSLISTVSMTPVTGTEVVSEESPIDSGKDKSFIVADSSEVTADNEKTTKAADNNKNIKSNSNNNGNNNKTVVEANNGENNNTNVIPQEPSLDDKNNSFRREIENAYGISIKYGSETNGYTVGGISTVPITDPNVVATVLNDLNYSLSLYPSGLFSEIRNGGIPLTIVLVNNYYDNTITGVTDSDYSSATISIAAIYPFGESFYHESFHYIERYMLKKGATYATWDYFNPTEFSYGNIRNDYSYANTFVESSPFVNNYAQTDAAEDRASTFEYMMAPSKASCLNYGTTVWQKANFMAENMDAVLNSVKPDVREYWERYLY